MQFSDNKFITILAISNIIAFIIIFILFWILWNDDNLVTEKNNINSTEDLLTAQDNAINKLQNNSLAAEIKPETIQTKKSIIEAINEEVNASDLNKLSVLDSQKPISNETGKTPISDKDYIDAFKQLDTKNREANEVSEKQLTTVQVVAKLTNSTDNHFNKIDISNTQRKKLDTASLSQQIEDVVTESKKEINTTGENPAWKDYLAKLKSEGKERRNEVRTIQVKQGETLWRISVRAYGNGFLYKKIFKANPHLTSPDTIRAGEILRVPL